MPVVTISDYANTAPQRPWRNTSHFARQCPNYRTCFPGLSQSFNIFVASRTLRLRRLPFVLSLVLRLFHTAYFFSPTSFTRYIQTDIWAIPLTISNILFFFFLAWNLHLIVNMEGERKVFGRTFGRRSFDNFLWGVSGFHQGIVGMEVWNGVLIAGSEIWTAVFLVVYGVCWVATWDPEDGAVRLPF